MKRRKAEGFTLIELLLVVVIIGILAAIVVPKLTGRSEEARIAKARADLATFRTALNTYDVDNGRCPNTEQGLMALVVKPTLTPEPKNWKGPYLDVMPNKDGSFEVPKDPWGNDYIYVFPGAINTTGYDLRSMGPDGQDGNEDDIDRP